MAIAVTAFVAIILFAAFIAGWQLRKLVGIFENLEDRIARLEEAQTNRNPYRTNDGLEDAMSISWDVIQRAAETLDYNQRRSEQLLKILQVIRSNPDQYDSEKPNGKQAQR